MHIGIFGGTFNPIHRCHLLVADDICKKMALDQIVFIPAGIPPHKAGEEILDPRHRVKMVRLAIQPFKQFLLSEVEVDRPGKSYAVDTVEQLTRSDYPGEDLYFIIGLDAFLEIESWKDAGKLLSLCHFIVISRKGFFFRDLRGVSLIQPAPVETLHRLDREEISHASLPLVFGKQLHLLFVPHCEASSTQIRTLLSTGKQAKNLLPHLVESYIINNKLYQSLEEKP